MIWYIAAGILFVIAMLLLVLRFVMDRRYLRKKTSEAMARDLWAEIEEERESSQQRRDAFRSALKSAEKEPDS